MDHRLAASDPIPAMAGIGLRARHHRQVVAERPAVPWFEVHTENHFRGDGLRLLERIRRDYPISCHSVGLSLGSAEGVDQEHLARVTNVVARVEPALISDHLSWSVVDGAYLGDLLPMPLTEEALAIVCQNVDVVQGALGRTILIENPSSYGSFACSSIPESEFLAAVCARTGCRILCDINNISVSAGNLGFDPARFLDGLPGAQVAEYHLAGHAVKRLADGRILRLDDHGSQVKAEVWALFEAAVRRIGPRPTLIEWDTDVPELSVLLDEAARAQAIIDQVSGRR